MTIRTLILRNLILTVFLLDADVVIWCADNGKLDALFKNKKIKIPQIIYDQIIHYTVPVTHEKRTILLNKYLDQGSLEIVDNPVTEEIGKIRNSYKKCPQLAEIHDGESECIALLLENKEFMFCTGDIDTMKVIGFWGLSEQAISLEELVGKIRNLRYDFSKDCMKKHLEKGSVLKVQSFNWD